MADSLLNDFVASGTAAQMALFTPSPPTPASGPSPGYFFFQTDTQDTYSWDAGGAAWVKVNSGAGGTVTHTGALTAGQLVVGNGVADLTVGDLSGDVSTSGSGVTTIGALKVATGMIQASAVTLAKIQNAAANSVLVGSGAAGSGAAYAEIALGTNLSMSGTTLNAAGSTAAPTFAFFMGF